MITIGFLGGGQMAEAMIGGLAPQKEELALDFVVYDPNEARCDYLHQTYGVTVAASNEKAMDAASVVVIAVKPQVYPEIEETLAAHYRKEQLFVSIMAGVPIAALQGTMAEGRILRLMPNTAMAVGAGVCLMSHNEAVSEEEITWLSHILGKLGTVTQLPEDKINAATAISGSGPAFFYAMIESLVLGGIAVGLPKNLALTLAVDTMYGSAKMLREKDLEPTQLRDAVLSPGGTTIEGLGVLEHGGFTSILMDAVAATAAKGEALGKRKDKQS